MAGSQGSPARAQRLTAIVATLLLAAATAFAFGRVFEDHASTYRILVAGLASGLIACALERRNLVLATLASALALLWAVALLVFPETLWHGLPSLDTLHAIWDAAALVGEQARTQVAPTPPSDPLLLACVTGIWAAVFSSHALAFRAGSPLLALVPPLALVAFADSVLEDVIRPLYGVAFLIAALAVLFADALRRVQGWGPVWTGPGRDARLLSSSGRGARRVAAAAVGLALVSPLLIPGFGSQALLDFSTKSDRVRIDPFVSIRASLTSDDPHDLFTVSSPKGSYWRMLSLPKLDDSGFSPDDSFETQGLSGDAVPTDASGATAAVLADAEQITQNFQAIDDLGLQWLAMSFPPARVEVDRDVAWAAETGTANLVDPLDAGDTYTATSYVVQPTADELRLETFPTPAQDARYTSLPSNEQSAQIQALATQWTDREPTTYDKIIAIQDKLRDGEYEYSLDVPARDSSFTLLDFLTVTKAGFCQQFSSAMAQLLRSIGIPARVAVGFTAGTRDATTGLFTVSTADAHSWVEVRFPTYGWLAFEPTPGRANPIATYDNPQTAGAQCTARRGCIDPGQPLPDLGAPADAGVLRKQQDPFTPGVAGELGPIVLPPAPTAEGPRWTARRSLWVLLGIAALVLLLVPPVRAWRRHRRLRRARHDPRRLILTTYDVFTERAGELGFVRQPGDTLEEYRTRIVASGRLTDGHLARLTAATAGAAYSPREPGDDDAKAASIDASEALAQIRKGTSLAQRAAGAYRRS